MVSRNNTKTLRDLIVRAGDDFENSISTAMKRTTRFMKRAMAPLEWIDSQ